MPEQVFFILGLSAIFFIIGILEAWGMKTKKFLFDTKMKDSFLLTIVIFLIAITIIIMYYEKILDINELSAFGSIFAAAGGLIAIVWFYNSLQQQTIQLNEQRKQFQLEFNNLRLESKRSVIATVKLIIEDMEIKVNTSLNGLGKLQELPTLFMTHSLPLLKPITESEDYEEVLEAINNFNLVMTPARTFLSLMKDAGTLFLENDGIPVIGNDEEPEWFIHIYQEHLKGKPFISPYLGTAILLAGFMVKIKLKTIFIATETSLALMNSSLMNSSLMKEDLILKDVLEFKEKNNFLPKIAEIWLETLPDNTNEA